MLKENINALQVGSLSFEKLYKKHIGRMKDRKIIAISFHKEVPI